MDWKSFISSVVSNAMWPGVAVVAMVVFRDPLKALITNTKHFKGFGIDAEFNEQAQSVAIEAERMVIQGSAKGELTAGVQPEQPARGEGVASVTGVGVGTVTPENVQFEDQRWGDKLRVIAGSSPRSVVTEAWTHVEDEITRLAKPFGLRTNAMTMLRALVSAEVIPGPLGGLIQDLRVMRNKVAHESALDPGEDGAIAYLEACVSAVAVLKTINA